MSELHPLIAITGSSGAGTTSVTRTFENVFRRENVTAAGVHAAGKLAGRVHEHAAAHASRAAPAGVLVADRVLYFRVEERLGELTPELILLDLMMPEMDGFEFLDELRRLPAGRNIPVVVFTAKELTAEDRRRLSGSVERTLAKGSVSREALLAEVGELVAASLARRRAGP